MTLPNTNSVMGRDASAAGGTHTASTVHAHHASNVFRIAHLFAFPLLYDDFLPRLGASVDVLLFFKFYVLRIHCYCPRTCPFFCILVIGITESHAYTSATQSRAQLLAVLERVTLVRRRPACISRPRYTFLLCLFGISTAISV